MVSRGKSGISIRLIALLAFFMFFPRFAQAVPALSGVSATPGEVWLGQGVLLSAVCTDAEGPVSRVYAEVSGPSIILPPADFSMQENDTFTLALSDADRYSRVGAFSAAIYCVSANGTGNKNATFSVSKFTGDLSSVSPSPAYVGDTIEAGFFAKKDSLYLSHGIAFNVSLNGAPVALEREPAYDPSKGWILRFAAPAAGTYSLAVTAHYGGISATAMSPLAVKDAFEFSISGVDKQGILPGDNITATLSASSRGTPIVIDKSMLSAKMGSYNAEIAGVYPSGAYYKAIITAPQGVPGSYGLAIGLSYGNISVERSVQLTYMVPASGKLTDTSGAPVSAAIYFTYGASSFSAKTDIQGSYSLNIPSGTYDVKIVADKMVLTLPGVQVSGFEDPVKLYYVADAAVPGMKSAGIFVYETSLAASGVTLAMTYDEKKASSEQDLAVYWCPAWSAAQRACAGKWEKVPAGMDTIRNTAQVSAQKQYGAYMVANVDALLLDFSADRDKYFVGETIKASGISENAAKSPVGGAIVSAWVMGGVQARSVNSSPEGVFSIEIPVPEKEGNYTVAFGAALYPYAGYNTTRKIEVLRSREVSVLIPDTVRIAPGDNATVEVSVVNTGQTDLSGAKLSLSGVPENYFTISPGTLSVDAGSEKKFIILFNVPSSAPKTTYGADLIIPFLDSPVKKTFAMTITAPETSAAQPSGAAQTSEASGGLDFTLPTGLVPAASAYDVAYLVALAIGSFSLAESLRRRRIAKTAATSGTEGFMRKAYLLEIKRAVEKGFGDQLRALRKRSLSEKYFVRKKPSLQTAKRGVNKQKTKRR